jgi:hypothetical protein
MVKYGEQFMVKTNHLQALGITVWRLRTQMQVSCYHLLDAQSQCWGMLIAEVQNDLQYELLQAIVRALNMRAVAGEWAVVPRRVILGECLGVQYQYAEDIYIPYTLLEVLKNPSLKTLIWQKLSKLL